MKKFLSVLLSIVILMTCLSYPLLSSADTGDSSVCRDKKEMYNFFKSIRESQNLDNFTWQYDEDTIDSIDEFNNVVLPINENIILPEWSVSSDSAYDEICGVHGYIIQEANFCAERIPKKYMDLVKTACKWCDTKWYISKNNVTNSKKVDAVHACGNYLANIKYLWTLAPKIYHSNDDSVTNSEIKTACDKAFNSLSTKAKSRAATKELDERIRTILKDNKSVPSGITNQTQGGRCKYIIFGMILHLMGDLYAHRLIIPKAAINYIDGGTYNSKKTYEKTDVDRKQAFINDVKNKKVTFTEAHKRSKNKNEYNYLKESVKKSKYEDKPSFWPDRIDEATGTAYNFLLQYSEGFWPEIVEPIDFNDGLEYYDEYLSEVD